ncbi:MAG: glycosyltransferase family 4 protein [Parvularculaceae bacterium]
MSASNRPLKINILIHRPSPSGGARVIARYARLLKEKGHEVTITGLTPRKLGMREKLKRLLKSKPPLKSHFDHEGLELNLVADRMDVRGEDLPDADIVVATFWITAEWMALLPRSKGKHVYFVQGHEAALDHVDTARAEKTYRSDAYLITVSNWLSGVLLDKYRRGDADIVLNAIDAHDFAPLTPRNKNSSPVVGFLASNNAVKRTDIAVAVLEKLKLQIPDLSVRAFSAHAPGEGYDAPSWMNIAVAPSPEEIREIYGACDLWLFTSDEEGFGLPILEAFAAGTPVLARPAGAAPDLVTSENGALIDSSDPHDIAEEAARILSAPAADWKKMSDKALAAAQARSWRESAAEFEAALYRALDQHQ